MAVQWTREGESYRSLLDDRVVEARRVSGGWVLCWAGEELRVANPRLRTWLRARPVLEQVLRARAGGSAVAPTTPSWRAT